MLLLLFSCENDIETINLLTYRDTLPVESGKNVEIIYSDSAKIKFKLIAPQMDRYLGKKAYVELTKGVEIEFYDGAMNVKSKLTANYAIRDKSEKKMEVKNNENFRYV